MSLPPLISRAGVAGLLFFCLSVLDLSAQRRGLWVDTDRVDELRQAFTVAESHHARTFTQVQAFIEAQAVTIITVPNRLGSNWNYDRSYLAQQAALVALLSSDLADQTHYAAVAYDALRAMYDSYPQGENSPRGR